MFFLYFGGGFFLFGLEEHSVALFAAAVISLLLSVRPLWNAFKPRKVNPVVRKDSAHE